MTQTAPQPVHVPTAGASPAIEVADLHCRYGAYAAVRGVDLRVQRGEVFALLGTNGAGKTTTLEVLEGFHQRVSGTVRVLGVDPGADRAALQPRMGVMLQNGGFIDELTVAETLRLWGRLVDRGDDPERLLTRFELADRRDVAVGKLSGGQRRRLDLALSVWGAPELVILDEPTTGLDPESRRRTWDAIGELSEAGCTVVLTTHYLEEAEALADRIAIMHDGRIAVSGTLAEIVARRPASFTAWVPAAHVELPELAGELELVSDGPGTRIQVSTHALQSDLTRFLIWARRQSAALEELRAAPASLAEVYHAIRSADQEEADR